ncbi:MAG: rhodanese-like domain-containing protein [Acidobacteriota bacterium]
MNLKVLTVCILATIVFASSCNNAAKPPVVVNSTPSPVPARADSDHADDGHDAPRISLAEAKKDFDAGTAVFIDTHAPEQYAQQHIPGSINVPANNLEPYLNKIPKGKKIIAYCS